MIALSVAHKESVVQDLAIFIDELWRIESPRKGFVWGLVMRPTKDHRFDNGKQLGPFNSLTGFHVIIRRDDSLSDREAISNIVYNIQSRVETHRSNLNQGHFSLANIIVRSDIAAIVEGESDRRWPEYWKHAKSSLSVCSFPEDSYQLVEKHFSCCPDDLTVPLNPRC